VTPVSIHGRHIDVRMYKRENDKSRARRVSFIIRNIMNKVLLMVLGVLSSLLKHNKGLEGLASLLET